MININKNEDIHESYIYLVFFLKVFKEYAIVSGL